MLKGIEQCAVIVMLLVNIILLSNLHRRGYKLSFGTVFTSNIMILVLCGMYVKYLNSTFDFVDVCDHFVVILCVCYCFFSTFKNWRAALLTLHSSAGNYAPTKS
jgi:hypothetical protein